MEDKEFGRLGVNFRNGRGAPATVLKARKAQEKRDLSQEAIPFKNATAREVSRAVGVTKSRRER